MYCTVRKVVNSFRFINHYFWHWNWHSFDKIVTMNTFFLTWLCINRIELTIQAEINNIFCMLLMITQFNYYKNKSIENCRSSLVLCTKMYLNSTKWKLFPIISHYSLISESQYSRQTCNWSGKKVFNLINWQTQENSHKEHGFTSDFCTLVLIRE